MQFTGPDCYKYNINGLNLQKIHLNMYNISEDETLPPFWYAGCRALLSGIPDAMN